jgi:Ca-activated chloride channel family protein
LKPLFGVRRVNGLEYLMDARYEPEALREELARLGYDPDAELSGSGRGGQVYAENVREQAREMLRPLLVRESLDFGLQCAETAFIAVRSEAGERIEEVAVVANALPSGWDDHFLSGGAMLRSMSVGPDVSKMASLAAPGPSDLLCAAVGAFTGRGARLRTPVPEADAGEPEGARPAGRGAAAFEGVPTFEEGVAVLLDSARAEDAARLPDTATLSAVELSFPDGAPDARDLDPGLVLLIYVDDLAAPRARVRLADLVRQGGRRPLNVTRGPGQVVRVTLEDRAGAWAQSAPRIGVTLAW